MQVEGHRRSLTGELQPVDCMTLYRKDVLIGLSSGEWSDKCTDCRATSSKGSLAACFRANR